MLHFIVLLILYIYPSAQYYQKLSKYSSEKVAPDTQVYLDISSFKPGDILKFEFSMNLNRASSSVRNSYSFKIGQVFSSYYGYDSDWNSLKYTTSYDVECDSYNYCTFKWSEQKQAGTYQMFIIPLTPYSRFNWDTDNRIKVNHTGGLSTGAIVGIVFGCIGGVVLLIVVIYKCCNSPQKPDYASNDTQAPLTTVQPIIPPVVQPVTPVVQPIVPVQPIVQVQPMVPTYGPPPPQPYVHNVY